jgi:NAD(P)-dependent dehydrogenase (short-subunit alcohol dehydrogenase family)
MDIRDKVALITGSSKRLGRATAIELAKRGARIAIHYRSNEAEAVDTLRLVREAGTDGEIFQAELTKSAEVQAMADKVAERFQRLDILINNASLFLRAALDNTTPEQWDEQMDANAKAPFLLAQYAAKLMKAGGAGKIINLADVAGEVIWPGYFAYSVSKAALIAINRGLAKTLAPEVQVNAIAPGPVLFPSYYTEEQKRIAIERTLLKRAGNPQDVVNAVIFLIENDYITGELLHIDGGRHLV